MLKKLLRESVKEKRKDLTEEIAAREGHRLLQSLQYFGHYRHWLLYFPIQNEISTRPIFEWLQASGAKTYFPRLAKEQMEFYEVHNWGDFKVAKLAPEPDPKSQKLNAEIKSIALIPGLGFSKGGQRLGFGRGFYDRFLQTHSHILRIGLAYPFQLILEAWDPEPHDEVMDFVATPEALWGSKRIL